MDDNNDHARIVEQIIAYANDPNTAIPTYTDKERSQADMFMNVSAGVEGDTAGEDGDTAVEDDDNPEASNEVYISCVKFIIINSLIPPILTYTLPLCTNK